MRNRTRTGVVLLGLVQALAGCDGSRSSLPSAPSSGPSLSALVMFREKSSGFSTSELRDAQEQVGQFTPAHELIWTADGTRLPGFRAEGNFTPAETACKCTLVVHFGTRNGERRAYLTADYIHDNP